MAAQDDGEKTEEATPQKRLDFRKRGQVAQTKELSTAMMLVFSLVSIWLTGKFFFQELYDMFHVIIGDHIAMTVRDGGVEASAIYAFKKVALLVAPIGIFLWIVSAASSLIQVGVLHNEDALKLKFDKIDPIAGFKRVFSMKSLVEGLKVVLKVSVVGFVVYLVLNDEIKTIPKLMTFDVAQMMAYMGAVAFKLVGGVGMFMFIVAGIDYLYQRYTMEEQMKMTKQEVKEEHKTREGDPLIRARIRRAQREMAQSRMMNDVPTADVIITNPTHIAVAIKYSADMVAPTIIAMGADFIAQKIKEVAKENNIPIVENKPLARSMFKTLEIGQIIPKELYATVAEILSYVFKLKRRGLS